MKRIVTTTLAVGLLGAFGFTSVAAQEAAAGDAAMEEEAAMEGPAPLSVQVYGSLRYGFQNNSPSGGNSTSDYGSGHGSRIGIRGSADLGNGLTAGYQVERGISDDSLGQRFHNVSLGGDFGTLTLGRQGSPYYSATSFDGAPHAGGGFDVGDKITGIGYSGSFGGPFTLSVLVSDDDESGAGDGADILEITGGFAAGPISINAGHINGARDAADMAPLRGTPPTAPATERVGDSTGVTVGGNVAAINWEVGFQTGDKVATCTDSAGMMSSCDSETFGLHVGYQIGAGNAFLQMADRDSDNNAMDADFLLIGYHHDIAPGVNVAAIFRTRDGIGMNPMAEDETTILRLKVDF